MLVRWKMHWVYCLMMEGILLFMSQPNERMPQSQPQFIVQNAHTNAMKCALNGTLHQACCCVAESIVDCGVTMICAVDDIRAMNKIPRHCACLGHQPQRRIVFFYYSFSITMTQSPYTCICLVLVSLHTYIDLSEYQLVLIYFICILWRQYDVSDRANILQYYWLNCVRHTGATYISIILVRLAQELLC